MGEINQKPYERELDYIYGRFSGKSTLDTKIQNAEEILNQQRQSAEDNLEEMFDRENFVRLQNIPQKNWTFTDCEIFNTDFRRPFNRHN